METFAIGVDIGGSHISCAACDLIEKKYMPGTHAESGLNNQGNPDEIITIWANTIQETILKLSPEKIRGIGFAMPGPFDYVKGVATFKGNNKKYESLYGLNVSDALRKKMNSDKDFPVRFINDATAFALGEDWLGKAAGSVKSLSITLGTGFGSAFLDHHLPVVTGDTVPETGSVWHLPYKDGSADDYFSTRGLLNRFYENTGKTIPGVRELASMANDEPLVQSLFDDFGMNLGAFLFPWIEKTGTEVLVIGGNISHAFNLFGDSLRNYLAGRGSLIRIAVSELKETASIIGSALLADDKYYMKLLPALKHM